MSGEVKDKRYLIDNFYCQIDMENITDSPKKATPPRQQEIEDGEEEKISAPYDNNNKLSLVPKKEIDEELSDYMNQRMETEMSFEKLNDSDSRPGVRI